MVCYVSCGMRLQEVEVALVFAFIFILETVQNILILTMNVVALAEYRSQDWSQQMCICRTLEAVSWQDSSYMQQHVLANTGTPCPRPSRRIMGNIYTYISMQNSRAEPRMATSQQQARNSEHKAEANQHHCENSACCHNGRRKVPSMMA